MHQQTRTAHHAQQTELTNRLHQTCSTHREKNNKEKTRGRDPSANKKRQPQQTSVMKKLDYTSRFMRVIPTLSPNQSSHNSIGHGGRYNMVVTASTTQQLRNGHHRNSKRSVLKKAKKVHMRLLVSLTPTFSWSRCTYQLRRTPRNDRPCVVGAQKKRHQKIRRKRKPSLHQPKFMLCLTATSHVPRHDRPTDPPHGCWHLLGPQLCEKCVLC